MTASPEIASALVDLGLALGLGMLVGLQREWADTRVAGIRTFPLITVFGTVTALLAGRHGGWVLAAGALGIAAVVVLGDVALLRRAEARSEEPDPGITTETAVLLMFGAGALLPLGYRVPVIVLTGTTALLLHWKEPLHALVEKVGRDDVQAIMRFVLVAAVILPVLPDRSYGPYAALNPFQIWLMVVLIVGISLGAYVASQVLGARRGTIAAGVLGGLISSTATTVSYARRSKGAPGVAVSASLVVILASTVVFVRVLAEIVVVAPGILAVTGPPLGAMMALMAAVSAGGYLHARGSLGAVEEPHGPPSELKGAIAFGLLYAAVVLGVSVARQHFGEGALYLVAGLSGLTDVDAITLSTAQLVRAGELEQGTGWRLILVGAMANILFKGVVVAALGTRGLARRMAVLFGLGLLGGTGLLLLWP